ncbi:MAG: NAD(+) diphosphatase [Bacteroidaceae bacterium]|nr:NAD(+) diphosphatase [Bacteroidaceae bacterium]
MRYFAFCGGDILLTREGGIPAGDLPPVPLKPWQEVTRLREGGDTVVAIRLDAPVADRHDLRMMGLRQSCELLSPSDYRLAGKCAELLYWDSGTKYCGVCGSPLRWTTPISKQCPQCGKEWWPSPAVAVIVRILRGDEMLMIRAHNFRSPHYGHVAGFVELGESMEQAVLREVREEVGLEITNLRYFGSQPWPYPCGLMVAFTADYVSGEIRLQRSELAAAGWFRRHHLPQLPGPASISRWLVDDWLGGEEGG